MVFIGISSLRTQIFHKDGLLSQNHGTLKEKGI